MIETLVEAVARRDEIVAQGHSLRVAAWQTYMEYTRLVAADLEMLETEDVSTIS